MRETLIFCQNITGNWEKYLLDVCKCNGRECAFIIHDGNFCELVLWMSIECEKFEKKAEVLEKEFEDVKDRLGMAIFESKLRQKHFDQCRKRNFEGDCFWLIDSQICKGLAQDLSFFQEFLPLNHSFNSHLRSLESIKSKSIEQIITSLSLHFKNFGFSTDFPNEDFFFLQDFSLNLIDPLPSTPDDFISVQGILFMHLEISKQWQGCYSILTLDKFLHFFASPSKITPILSLNLQQASIFPTTNNSEFLFKIHLQTEKYEIRTRDSQSFQSWKSKLFPLSQNLNLN